MSSFFDKDKESENNKVNKNSDKDKDNKFKQFVRKHKVFFFIVWVLFVLVLLSYYRDMLKTYMKFKDIKTITYNEFLVEAQSGNIYTISYNKNSEYMLVIEHTPETKGKSVAEIDEMIADGFEFAPEYYVRVPYPAYDNFRLDMLTYDINMVITEDKASLLSILTTILSVGLPLIYIFFLFKILKTSLGGGSLSKETLIQTSNVKFSDVIGHDEILEDVESITNLIKDPTKGDRIGAKVPKGLLLSGPPGTGKTLIAKAIAGESNVPFLYMNASGFIELYVGMGAKRVRELFKIAKEHSPCIIFLDEIDAIGGNRESNRGTSENDQTINALLQEMDGFNSREGIFVIAATNRADILDPALVRAGRFDRQIVVNPPRDWKVRTELFNHYLSKFKVGDDVNVENLSRQVSGFTGADIEMVCNEASIVAMMKNKPYIDTECIEEAIDKKVFKGNRSKKEFFIEDKKIVAYHESGHAIMSYILGEPIARASIIGTVSGVGGAVFNEDTDSVFHTDEYLRHRVLIAYAGRASEEIKFPHVTTGASNDITQATQILLAYLENYGFDKDFGLLDISVLSKQHIIDSEIVTSKLSAMSKELYAECKSLLDANYSKVELLATTLLEKETLSGEEITALLNTENNGNVVQPLTMSKSSEETTANKPNI